MILFFIVGVSSLSTIGIYSYFNSKNALLQRTLDQLTSIRVIKKDQIEFFFNERFNNLSLISERDYISRIANEIVSNKAIITPSQESQKDINSTLFGFSNMYLIVGEKPEYLQFFKVTGPDYSTVDPDSSTKAQLIRLWEKSKLTNAPAIIDFFKRSSLDDEPQCLIGKQILRAFNGKTCSLALQISINDINRIMLEDSPKNGLGKTGEVYLVGDDYLMRSDSRFIPHSVLNTLVKTTSSLNAFRDKTGSAIIDDYRTIACLSSYDRINIPGLSWAIIAEIDYSEAMIPIVSIRNDIIFISLIICVLLFSIAHIISRTISQPIIKLKNTALKIGEGNFDINLRTMSRDEIGSLYDAFNTMAEQLKIENQKRMTALYDGQEMERQRISRDLHDGLGQKLIALKLQLESTSKQNTEETRATIEEVKISFLKTIEEVRDISNNLSPHILDEWGLDIALKNLCDSIRISSSISIDLSSHGDYAISETKIKYYIYRIAQEALNNAVKHSGALNIQVQMIWNKENIILVIEDDGRGFKYDDCICEPCNGIYNMKERARLLNGTIDIETESQKGTTIRLKVPRQLI